MKMTNVESKKSTNRKSGKIEENSSSRIQRRLGTEGIMDHSKELTHISFCSGYGGLDLGIRRIFKDLRTIAYCERESRAIANLVTKMENGWLDSAPIWTNLEDFPYEQFYGLVDIVSGGIPCQPFSLAGKREVEKSEKFLYPFFSNGVALCNPKVVLIENVAGLRSATFDSELSQEYIKRYNTNSVLLYILKDLERLGYSSHYRVEEAEASSHLPHSRRRLFIGGVRNDLDFDEIQEIFREPELLSVVKAPNGFSKFQWVWEEPRGMDCLPKKDDDN
jgi:DNA (cytosine-5)-methyltransferase 1